MIRIIDDLTELHRKKETPFSKVQFGRAAALEEEGSDVVGFRYDYFQEPKKARTGYDFSGGRDFIEGYLGVLEQCRSPETLNEILEKKVAEGHNLQGWLGKRDVVR